MIEKKFNSVKEMVGRALPNIRPWEHLNLNYKVIASINEEKCIGCQLCYIACEDGAHQAIKLEKANGDRIPSILEENCVGCNLCALVCPMDNCITMIRKDDGKDSTTWKERADQGKIPTTFNDQLAGGVAHHIPEPKEALYKKKRS
jgi:dihydropyrimidine dehydrogenase (NAD+) subunit PreA